MRLSQAAGSVPHCVHRGVQKLPKGESCIGHVLNLHTHLTGQTPRIPLTQQKKDSEKLTPPLPSPRKHIHNSQRILHPSAGVLGSPP